MKQLLFVFIGGGAGSIARFLLGKLWNSPSSGMRKCPRVFRNVALIVVFHQKTRTGGKPGYLPQLGFIIKPELGKTTSEVITAT